MLAVFKDGSGRWRGHTVQAENVELSFASCLQDGKNEELTLFEGKNHLTLAGWQTAESSEYNQGSCLVY